GQLPCPRSVARLRYQQGIQPTAVAGVSWFVRAMCYAVTAEFARIAGVRVPNTSARSPILLIRRSVLNLLIAVNPS
ncbi:MAG: hypothetical protein ACRDRS_08130, partial [Pseudonocardiaceae bacterium]